MPCYVPCPMCVNRVFNRGPLKNMNILINGQSLKEVDHAKYLGVHMDNKLTWNVHIDNIKLRLSKGISILSKIRHYVPKSVLRSLYFTFISSHTEYNLINWGTAPTTYLDSVSSKTRKAIRIISFKDKYEPHIPLFKELSILPLEKSIELKQSVFMWKLNNGLLPPTLTHNFRIQRNQPSIMHNRLDSSAKHITYIGPRIWNKIPDNIRKTSELSWTPVKLNWIEKIIKNKFKIFEEFFNCQT